MRRLFLIQLNIINMTFENKPCFHAEVNFDDIKAIKYTRKLLFRGCCHNVFSYNGLASHPGGVEILVVASFYGNRVKLWPDHSLRS